MENSQSFGDVKIKLIVYFNVGVLKQIFFEPDSISLLNFIGVALLYSRIFIGLFPHNLMNMDCLHIAPMELIIFKYFSK